MGRSGCDPGLTFFRALRCEVGVLGTTMAAVSTLAPITDDRHNVGQISFCGGIPKDQFTEKVCRDDILLQKSVTLGHKCIQLLGRKNGLSGQKQWRAT